MRTGQVGGERADLQVLQMGATSVLHLASPPSYFHLLCDLTTCSFQSTPARNFTLGFVQRDSEILKCSMNGEHISANIWMNKLGLKFL